MAKRIDEVADAAGPLRPFLEPLWSAWKAASGRNSDPFASASEGMCGFTAAFVASALSAHDGRGWTVAGGWPRNGGGLVCPSGGLNAHFWSVSDDGLVVDLTADQFGMPTVLVTTVADPRYVEGFTPDEIERHLPRVAAKADEWLAEAGHAGLVPTSAALAA